MNEGLQERGREHKKWRKGGNERKRERGRVKI